MNGYTVMVRNAASEHQGATMGTQLAGKTAIVTGSTSGIGRATALLFAQEGANVVVTGRREALGAQVVQEIVDAGGQAIYIPADITTTDEVTRLMREAVAACGRVDVLVNNAIGFSRGSFGSVLEMSEEGWEVIVRSSLGAIITASKVVVPEMIRVGGGSIINMSSVHGLVAGYNMAAYNAVKAGMLNLTRTMAMDFGRKGIRVNAICPGCILTEREAAAQHGAGTGHPFQYKELTIPALYPLGRAGRPDEVAQACLFLASEASSFVTGATLVVDGGLTIQEPETFIVPLGNLFRETFAREWGIDLQSAGPGKA
jgi:NAD(P)-dependent dehydrogenase (short-subunit alcohol dehydrogenase family)